MANANPTDFAYILACGDPKIHQGLTNELDRRFRGRDKYFWLPELGGVKDLLSLKTQKRVLSKMETAARVHTFNLVLLINHSICGAYRLAGHGFTDLKTEEEFHKKELEKAKRVVQKKFPGVTVEIHYYLKKENKTAW